MATKMKFVDIYSLHDDTEAGVIESLLENYNISCMVNRFGTVGFVMSGIECNYLMANRVFVEEEGVENARQIITDAIQAGVISSRGRFEF